MHAKFNLNPENETWQNHFYSGNTIHEENKAIVETDLDRFKDINGTLQAKEIIENWFPRIKADVFLSHSHKDEKLIIGLAGWLKDNFGIKSFIDSTVWGYSDRLLKAIDNKYCKNDSGETYNYDQRNRSTSHVHMMLSTALADMIDQCECVIFVNTPNSFKPADYFKDEGETESPWIYSEIAMTRMLRERAPEEHRPQPTFESVNASLEHLKKARERELRISYPADLLHLTPLSLSDLTKWKNKEGQNKQKAYALDLLYEMKRK